MKNYELTGPIFTFKDGTPGEEMISYAAVLVPGEPDADADAGEKLLTEKEIERVAEGWLAEYGNIDLQHSLNNIAKPVQSFVTYSDREVEISGKTSILPKGTWILGVKHTEDTWAKVKDGSLSGLSVMGVGKNAIKSASKDADVALKRTLIKDLGDDWVAPFVSVVDEPCVPKAKWFAIKSKTPEKIGVIDNLLSMFTNKEGKKISGARRQKLLDAKQVLVDILAETDAETDKDKTKKSADKATDFNSQLALNKLDDWELRNALDRSNRDVLDDDKLTKEEKIKAVETNIDQFKKSILDNAVIALGILGDTTDEDVDDEEVIDEEVLAELSKDDDDDDDDDEGGTDMNVKSLKSLIAKEVKKNMASDATLTDEQKAAAKAAADAALNLTDEQKAEAKKAADEKAAADALEAEKNKAYTEKELGEAIDKAVEETVKKMSTSRQGEIGSSKGEENAPKLDRDEYGRKLKTKK